MRELYRNQTILAFWAPQLKIAQLLLTNTLLRTFLSKCRIFTHFAAIYPEITSRTVFKKKKIKRLKLKVCIFIYLPWKANSSHLYLFNHSVCHCLCCFHYHISNYNATCSCAHTCMQEHYNIPRGWFAYV